jgi:hypothetical protein
LGTKLDVEFFELDRPLDEAVGVVVADDFS